MIFSDKQKGLLRDLGLTEEDEALIDEKDVKLAFDEVKGVRLFDPYYRTSYREYIAIDGWSSWSSEKDSFLSDILGKGLVGPSPEGPLDEEARSRAVDEALRARFGGPKAPDPSGGQAPS